MCRSHGLIAIEPVAPPLLLTCKESLCLCVLQAHDFFSDAKEDLADAKDAVKDEADRASSSGPSGKVLRPSGLYGKDPIPSNTEDVEQWRRTHPRPARGTDVSDAGEGVKQAAKDSWVSVNKQTQEATNAANGSTKQTAHDAKGKAEEVKGKADETANQAKDKADETADGITGWAKSWFGKFTDHKICYTTHSSSLSTNLVPQYHLYKHGAATSLRAHDISPTGFCFVPQMLCIMFSLGQVDSVTCNRR